MPNHGALSPGDAIVLWDKRTLLGASVIDTIHTAEEVKTVNRCPSCGRASLKTRATLQPRHRCFSCGSLFDEPATETVEIISYRSRHHIGWVDLSGALPAATLRSLCVNPESQHSLRRLDWAAFETAMHQADPGLPLRIVNHRAGQIAADGHTTRTVRVRRGQAAFRTELTARYGEVCALSGPTPSAALEAAHLYSYAQDGTHHPQGGLLLRRDLHRLFDLGLLAVHPLQAVVDVSAEIADCPAYAPLHTTPRSTSTSPRGSGRG